MAKKRGTQWQGDVSFQGTRHRVSFATQSEADAWEKSTKARLLRGETVDPGQSDVVSLKELLDLTTARHWRGSKSEDTSVANAQACIRFLGEDRPAASVTERDIDAMVADFAKKGLSGGTINRKLAALSRMLRHGYSRRMLHRVPTIERQTEAEHRIRWYTQDEETRVLTWFNWAGLPDMALLCTLLADTGFRLSEAISLKWEDSQSGVVTVWGDSAKGGYSGERPAHGTSPGGSTGS